jgi:hypothetical protein
MNVGQIKIKGTGVVETPQEVQNRHEEMVLRLAKPGQAILESLTAEDCYLIHIAGCIPGEASELYEAWEADEPMLEELGDMEFYLTAMRQILNLPRNDKLCEDLADRGAVLIAIMVEGGKLWDVVKRRTIYRKDLNTTEAIRCVRQLESLVNVQIKLAGYTSVQVLDENFKKLADKDKGRYASGQYSDQQAQERRDKLSAG